MAWLADLAGKAENLLVNLDEQTGAALRNHSGIKPKRPDRREHAYPEPQLLTKKRPIPRTLKNMPSRKLSPSQLSSQLLAGNPPPLPSKDSHLPKGPRKSPLVKKYNLNNCPRTLVGDVRDNEDDEQPYGYKPRRFSLPSDLEGLSHDCLTYRLENLEVENAMLKNELNVTNREVKELLDRLHKTEEGEHVVDSSNEEISEANTQLETVKYSNSKLNTDKETLINQMEHLKSQINTLTHTEIQKLKDQKSEMENELAILRDRNKDLENLAKLFSEKSQDTDNQKNKLELDLRHALSTINVLQSDLEKSNNECKRLDKEWESYKNRVKSMLAAKDKEIKALQQGVNFSEDTKMLMEQVESLKEERENLSEAVNRVRNECGDMKQYMETLETRHNAGERLVLALRDALKDERTARNRAEAQCNNMAKELKCLQLETGQTIASLRTALRDKEQQLSRLRNSSSTMQTTESSALNVADYDLSRDSIENEKVYLLTQKLVQKQGKIDMLLADNNIMKIQLDKLESKLRTDMQSLRANTQSIVQVQDGDRQKLRQQLTINGSRVSRWFGTMFRRYPLFRILIVVYMILNYKVGYCRDISPTEPQHLYHLMACNFFHVCLHLWVFTVLLSNTPDNKFYLNS